MTAKDVSIQPDQIKRTVVERYTQRAERAAACCGQSPAPDCGGLYSQGELQGVPGEAIAASAGSGNPIARAGLQDGQTVLDLGSGGGIDAFLAARLVAPSGRVIGVDMTPAMIDLARRNAAQSGLSNVEFRLGDIESLPVLSGSIDVVISNCVINLAVDKDAVLREAFRVLKPGGKVVISDIVLAQELPSDAAADRELWAGCVSGAITKREYEEKLRRAGFSDVHIEGGLPEPNAEGWRKHAASAYLTATKPKVGCCGPAAATPAAAAPSTSKGNTCCGA